MRREMKVLQIPPSTTDFGSLHQWVWSNQRSTPAIENERRCHWLTRGQGSPRCVWIWGALHSTRIPKVEFQEQRFWKWEIPKTGTRKPCTQTLPRQRFQSQGLRRWELRRQGLQGWEFRSQGFWKQADSEHPLQAASDWWGRMCHYHRCCWIKSFSGARVFTRFVVTSPETPSSTFWTPGEDSNPFCCGNAASSVLDAEQLWRWAS